MVLARPSAIMVINAERSDI